VCASADIKRQLAGPTRAVRTSPESGETRGQVETGGAGPRRAPRSAKWAYAGDPQKGSRVSDACMHGFVTTHCASCRECPHGITTSRCGRCLAAAAAISPRTRRTVAPGPHPEPEEHNGWEIFYVPALSGWQVRSPEAEQPADSYRSVFLARKAIERLIANPPVAARSKRR
jgi:hypothetical protein